MSAGLWRGGFTFSLFCLNTLFFAAPILVVAVMKALIPVTAWRKFCGRIMIGCAESWIAVNIWVIDTFYEVTWDIEGLDQIQNRGSYLVISNHLSWLDIPVLQYLFNRRIPFLRFFLKSELFYIPVFGFVWWALDFPFMKRFSSEYLLRHPQKRGQDLATTKKSVEKFRGSPVSVLNFLEGTRFTPAKKRKQDSPYRHLLHPKIGGIAYVLQAMGDQFHAIVDVTIHYPDGVINIWKAMRGHWKKVLVRIRVIPIPAWAVEGDYLNDREHRNKMQRWIRGLWQEKDELNKSLSHSET